MLKLKVTTVGSSVGVILTKEAQARLVESVAAGAMTQDALAAWFRERAMD